MCLWPLCISQQCRIPACSLCVPQILAAGTNLHVTCQNCAISGTVGAYGVAPSHKVLTGAPSACSRTAYGPAVVEDAVSVDGHEDEHAGHAHRRMLEDDDHAHDDHSDHDHSGHDHDDDHSADEVVERVLTVESLEVLGEGSVNGARERCWRFWCCATVWRLWPLSPARDGAEL